MSSFDPGGDENLIYTFVSGEKLTHTANE